MTEPVFKAISIAPDIVSHCHLLHFPLAVLRGPNNALVVYRVKENGWDVAGGVERVWWAGNLALVQTRHNLYLLPAEGLPRPPVSAREREILHRLAAGSNTQAIAQQLYLSEGTIQLYIRQLLARLGANHRAHLIAIAKDQGLI